MYGTGVDIKDISYFRKKMVRERVQMMKQCSIMARTECTALQWTGGELENS